MVIIYLLIFVVGCYALARSGAVLVRVLTRLSGYFKLTEYVLAFVLMTFATTLPELLVGVTSAIKGYPVISLSNIIGSNLVNLTFILGLVTLVAGGLKVESKIAKRDSWIIFFIALLPLVLLFDKKISRGEGFLLVLLFGWYIYHILKQKDAFTHRVHHIKHDITGPEKLFRTFLYLVISIAVLVFSAWVVVESAKLIAENLYVPISLIGLILVAFGTSLPELVFGMRAVIAKHEGMCLGNIIGSIVINSTFILGVTAMITPIQIETHKIVYIAGGFMLFAILMANIFMASKNKISIKEALALIFFYLIFMVVEFLVK